MLLPPFKLTTVPLISTLLKGLPKLGKSKKRFQSTTLLESPTNKLAFSISSNVNVNTNSFFLLPPAPAPAPAPAAAEDAAAAELLLLEDSIIIFD